MSEWQKDNLVCGSQDPKVRTKMDQERQESTAPSFEQALEELEHLVAQLEEGKIPLEESMELFERGQQLAQRCNTMLNEAELRVKKIESDSREHSSVILNQSDDDS